MTMWRCDVRLVTRLLVIVLGLGVALMRAEAQGHSGHAPAAKPEAAANTAYQLGEIAIFNPWSRATAASAPVAVGYLKITNRGKIADRLVSARIDGVGEVEIHETSLEMGLRVCARLIQGLRLRRAQRLN